MEIVSISSIRHDVDWCLNPYDPPIIFPDGVWLGRVGCRVASQDDSLILTGFMAVNYLQAKKKKKDKVMAFWATRSVRSAFGYDDHIEMIGWVG